MFSCSENKNDFAFSIEECWISESKIFFQNPCETVVEDRVLMDQIMPKIFQNPL